MAEAAESNATLWAVTGPREIACFRVLVDDNGAVIRTTVADFNQLPATPSFDENLRAALQERYGPTTQVIIEVDGGADFFFANPNILPQQHDRTSGSRSVLYMVRQDTLSRLVGDTMVDEFDVVQHPDKYQHQRLFATTMVIFAGIDLLGKFLAGVDEVGKLNKEGKRVGIGESGVPLSRGFSPFSNNTWDYLNPRQRHVINSAIRSCILLDCMKARPSVG